MFIFLAHEMVHDCNIFQFSLETVQGGTGFQFVGNCIPQTTCYRKKPIKVWVDRGVGRYVRIRPGVSEISDQVVIRNTNEVISYSI